MIRNLIKSIVDAAIQTESLFVKSTKSTKKKVLILRKDGLGDCIIFYPTLKAYRDFYKDAEITLIFPRYFESLAGLLGKDLVDKVIWFDHRAFSSNFGYRRNFLLGLKKAGYDVALYPVFSRETIGDLMMKMTAAKEIVGFDGDPSVQGEKAKRTGNRIYTRLIRPPEEMRSEIERDKHFAEQVIGKSIDIQFPTFNVSLLDAREAEKIISANKLAGARYAVIFPGAGAQYRIWPVERWVRAIEHISGKGIIPVICGSEKEKALVKEISLRATCETVNLAGRTDLAALAHILKSSAFYFGSDTGILHLATAVGAPAIAIVGSGGLWRFFPYGDPAKNIAVYDTSRAYETGTWADAANLKTGSLHPSIEAVRTEDALVAIDLLIKTQNL